jgi:catechol 2,3-dioxygenase-like lactoylglutathione lyase family enzyme
MAIIGVHAMVYTKDAEADRAFLRDVLKFKHVDAGDGWLIFALPPTEVGVHPHDKNDEHELYLMTDDVEAEIARLEAAGSKCDPVQDQGYGLVTALTLPGGGKLGLYQPRHPLAHG